MKFHFLQKGKDRPRQEGISLPSQAICQSTDGNSTIYPHMVNCRACVRELLKLKIKEMQLTPIKDNFGFAGRTYCKSPDGDLYCIQPRYRTEDDIDIEGIYSADKSGEPITLIYPR